MTQNERAEVAREVTGQKWERPKGKSIVILGRNGSYADTWDPDFTGGPFKRSQALALVEWLANMISQMPLHESKEKRVNRIKLIEAIRFKNIDEMEQLVIDLRGKDD